MLDLMVSMADNRIIMAERNRILSAIKTYKEYFYRPNSLNKPKTESAYKLKAAHTASLRQTKTTLIPHRNRYRLLRYFPTDIERFYKKDSTPPSIDPRRHDVSST